MAFENMTYEEIVERIITRIQTEHPNLDTREGSMLFNAIAPCAMELAIAYYNLSNVLNESFVETASREFLYKKCDEIGMDTSQFNATNGEFKGEFDVEVPIGSRWNLDLYNYTVNEYLGDEVEDTVTYKTYRLICETPGAAPNGVFGSLTPIDNPTVVFTHAELTEVLVEGKNISTDDEIKDAYFNYVKNTATDGNVAQYEQWCSEYHGIGNYKIAPLWNGANTVKVYILSESNVPVSSELKDEFQAYLDPGITGMGDGVAPIGAFVTVDTGTPKTVTITGTIALVEGNNEESTKEQIDQAIKDYFASIAFQKQIISYMAVGAAVLNCPGVASLTNLTLNGGSDDITLGEYEVPVLGTTTWTVSA